MDLGLTESLTEMSARNLPGDKGRPARKADNLTAICEPIAYEMCEPRRLTTLRTSTACYRDTVHLFIFFIRTRIRSRQQNESSTDWFKYIKELRQVSKDQSSWTNQRRKFEESGGRMSRDLGTAGTTPSLLEDCCCYYYYYFLYLYILVLAL
jgi:hypothetical protein